MTDIHRYVVRRYAQSFPMIPATLGDCCCCDAEVPISSPSASTVAAPAGDAPALAPDTPSAAAPAAATSCAPRGGVGVAVAHTNNGDAVDTARDSSGETLARCIPENPSLASVAYALSCAFFAYGAAGGVVAFVTQPAERNIMDQRLIEHALWENHGVRSIRVTLASLATGAVLRPSDGALMYPAEGSCASEAKDVEVGRSRGVEGVEVGAASRELDEISVVYYRCGYTPDDHPTEAGELERSGFLLLTVLGGVNVACIS